MTTIIIAFILPLLGGSAYGVLLRTGFGVSSLFPKTLFVSGPTSDALPLGGKNAREAIQLALMRARLRALATTESEQRAILLKIVEDQAAFVAPRTTAENLGHLAALIDQALDSMNDMPPEKLPPEVRNLRLYLVAYSKDLKQFASKAESGGTISPALVGFVIGTVKHDLDGKMDQRSTDAMLYLSEHDLVRQRLADLRWALFEAAERLDGDPALNRPKVIQEVDGFLSLFSGDAAKASEGVMVSKPHLGPSFAP